MPTTALELVIVAPTHFANGQGGTHNPINLDLSHYHDTNSYALKESQLPSHHHAYTVNAGYTFDYEDATDNPRRGFGMLSTLVTRQSANVGNNQAHSHGRTLPSSESFQPRYRSYILAERD